MRWGVIMCDINKHEGWYFRQTISFKIKVDLWKDKAFLNSICLGKSFHPQRQSEKKLLDSHYVLCSVLAVRVRDCGQSHILSQYHTCTKVHVSLLLTPCRVTRAVPCRAVPCRAEPCRAEPSRAEPSQAEPSRAEPSRAKLSRAEPSQAEPSQAVYDCIIFKSCRPFLFNNDVIRGKPLESVSLFTTNSPR